MSTADPILASVLQRRVHAITQEMATVLMRSSRSPIFNEIGDLVTVIFDRRARTLAQTEYASIIANSAPACSWRRRGSAVISHIQRAESAVANCAVPSPLRSKRSLFRAERVVCDVVSWNPCGGAA